VAAPMRALHVSTSREASEVFKSSICSLDLKSASAVLIDVKPESLCESDNRYGEMLAASRPSQLSTRPSQQRSHDTVQELCSVRTDAAVREMSMSGESDALMSRAGASTTRCLTSSTNSTDRHRLSSHHCCHSTSTSALVADRNYRSYRKHFTTTDDDDCLQPASYQQRRERYENNSRVQELYSKLP